MKRTTLLHAELSEVIARLGHGDLLVIGDAGLPIPDGPRRIDLAVSANVPRFADVLAAVLAEMQVEGALIADELAPRQRRRARGADAPAAPHARRDAVAPAVQGDDARGARRRAHGRVLAVRQRDPARRRRVLRSIGA